MRFGGPISLGILGAILYFAVSVEVSGVSLSMIGLITMVGAGVWLLLGIVQAAGGNRTEATETVQHSDGSVEQKRTTVDGGPSA